MARNKKSKYETVGVDNKLPGKVLYYDKPGSECYTNKHWHKNLEIDYVVKGQMWTMQDNKDRDIGEGDYVVVNCESIHQTCGKYPNENVKYLVVLFSYNYIKQYFPNVDDYCFDPLKNDSARVKIRQLLKSIVYEIENPSEFSNLKNNSYMTEIMVELFTKCREERPEENRKHTEDLEYARKAMEFIRENYKEKISLDDISAYVGLTPTYFSRYFKQATNKTFKKYISLVRLENALLDIQNKGMSESAAAVANGFPSVKSFIETFKQVYKCSLSEYYKKYHEEPSISELRKL